jgi:hypothetical protein
MTVSGPRPWLVALAAVLAAAFAGYLIGSATASTSTDADAERDTAFDAAYPTALFGALTDAKEQGIPAGAAAGRTQGETAGARAGRIAGQSAAEADALGSAATSAEREFASQPNLAGSGGVLVVGDSLQELTEPYLREYLPDMDLTINAVGGYNSYQIFELFQQSYSPSQSVIVFDAGTNDNPSYPQILQENLNAVAEIVGNRCMVVPTIHGLTVDGVDSSGKNEVVSSFAESRPGTQVPDWAGAVAAHPELMQPDNLHPLPEGADLRAQLIAEGVRACLELV